jgi:hypothetical protein
MTRMLEEQNPTFPVVEDSLWPIDRDYLGQNPQQVMAEFTALRRTSSEQLLEASLSDWGRTGKHPLLGQITLRDYAEHVAQRDQEHLRQVRAALRLDLPPEEVPVSP